jgi:lipid-binding SYLF domain-containing protein
MNLLRYALLFAVTSSSNVFDENIHSIAPMLISNSTLTEAKQNPPVDPNQPGGPQKIVKNAGGVITEILKIPDNIPLDLLDKARCIIAFPSVSKAAFVIGGSFGSGVMVCRTHKDFTGPWGAPTMMALEGGTVGFQIGGQATDFILLVMNERGVHSILDGKVKIGADASVAAGPKGRDASADTDVTMRAEMLSYSRSRGLFAGISLEGSTVRLDNDGNKRLYGKEIAAKEIVTNNAIPPPVEATALLSALTRKSPGGMSDR